MLWSRSRGVVFSGVRLPAVAQGMTYQLWLLTDGLPVTAGTFNPQPDGQVTFTADAPRVPRPVIGAAVPSLFGDAVEYALTTVNPQRALGVKVPA